VTLWHFGGHPHKVPLSGPDLRLNVTYVIDDDRALAQLDRLSADFPAFAIWLEPMADNSTRFVARNRHPDVHPRMVVTSDVAELRAALSAGQPPA
jgi:hypothetical protein